MERPRPHLTKERIYIEYPDYYGMEMIRRHLRRYEWAKAHLLPTDIVLDAGCGSGYGSRLMRPHCKAVTGIDLSAEAVQYAQGLNPSEEAQEIDFFQGDLSSLQSCPFKHKPFDTVVCIEVIEHLSAEQQYQFMREVVRLLSPQGRLLITTPVKGDRPMTEYHVKEFARDEFRDFLARYFEDIVLDSAEAYHISPPNFILARCSAGRSL